jgi:hypothetical protein
MDDGLAPISHSTKKPGISQGGKPADPASTEEAASLLQVRCTMHDEWTWTPVDTQPQPPQTDILPHSPTQVLGN